MPAFETLPDYFDDFGNIVTWTPAAGGTTYTTLALLDTPDETYNIGMSGGSLPSYVLTYPADALPGLKTAVDVGSEESVTMGGNTYLVREVNATDDGSVLIAKLGVWR